MIRYIRKTNEGGARPGKQRPLPILEGTVERNRPDQLILTEPEALKSRRIVRDLDLQPLEESGSVRLLPRPAKRP